MDQLCYLFPAPAGKTEFVLILSGEFPPLSSGSPTFDPSPNSYFIPTKERPRCTLATYFKKKRKQHNALADSTILEDDTSIAAEKMTTSEAFERIYRLEKMEYFHSKTISTMMTELRRLAPLQFFKPSRAGPSRSPYESEAEFSDFSLASAFGKDFPNDAATGEVSSYPPYPDPYAVPLTFEGDFGTPYADIGHVQPVS